MAKKRLIYRVVSSKSKMFPWKVTLNRKVIDEWIYKTNAVGATRALAREAYDDNHLAQLVVHGRDGKIQYENTYGADPRKSKG